MNDQNGVPRHPIRVVAQRTGLTPATIRAWERRYGAVTPARTEGGQRLYSDHDVDRLGKLRRLTEVGRPISMVAELSDDDVSSLLLEDRAATPTPDSGSGVVGSQEPIDQAFAQMVAFDAPGLEQTLWRTAMTLPARVFLDDVVSPLLSRVGAAWESGELSPAQEHLGSEVVDRVLEHLAEPSKSLDGPVMIVATLPGERHGLGARLVSTTAILEGWSVTFLGTDLPVPEIVSAAEAVSAAAVALSVVSRGDLEATKISLAALRTLLPPSVALVIGGRAAPLLEADGLPPGVTMLSDLDGFRELCRNRRASAPSSRPGLT